MKATMKDVAALAGVGVGTVSRVINGVKVKEITRKKVEAAINELSYEPDEYARALKTNRSNTLALILPTIWHPFFSELAYYIEEELSKKGYKLYLCNADGDPEKEYEYIQMVKQNKVDGIIGITYSDVDKYVSSNLPFVSIDRHFSEDVTYVTSDNFAGGRLAAKELVKRGCKTVAYIGGFSPFPNETVNRREGFLAYCRDKKITYKILDMPEPITDLREQILQFIKKNDTIDGIFTVNDFMGLNVLEMLETIGKTAPKDFQLIGFDGVRMAQERKYALSTIAQSVPLMAVTAVDAILNKIKGVEVPKRIILPVTFVSNYTTIENDKDAIT
ncbi:LacI family DNA-binding transcriptional regulator [Enterococcus ureilyticus]|uniref:LacI family DNA-binding transcriptional regulator n=1 Tax=Enterococcus ureilyticus TaxID=1131292 RepID=UPI001A936B9E|nr:LacI family DNA-binding transcriptional regulator [Enterococcus ureilyticus]MBO0446666.1 LacI family DNA-binding transcriptional regulator [Enterococcus ureilyticus]